MLVNASIVIFVNLGFSILTIAMQLIVSDPILQSHGLASNLKAFPQ